MPEPNSINGVKPVQNNESDTIKPSIDPNAATETPTPAPAPAAPAPTNEVVLTSTVEQIPTVSATETKTESAETTTEENTLKPSAPEEKKEEKEAKKIVTKNPDAFNSSEQVLFTKKEEKESSPIMVFILLALFVAFIFFLPTINGYVQNWLHPSLHYAPPVAEVEPEVKQSERHKFDEETLLVEVDELEFSNFVFTEEKGIYDLTFTLINKSEDPYLFENKLYFSFYNGDKLLYRALIQSYEPLASLSTKEMSVITNKIVNDNADQFAIEYINESAYPEANIDKVEEEYNVLTCHYNNDEILYYFKDNLLTRIKETYTEEVATSYDYENIKSQKYSQHLVLKSTTGIDSTFVETDTYFTVINDITLGETDFQEFQKLQIYYFYKNNANKNVVAFETKALGYTCS